MSSVCALTLSAHVAGDVVDASQNYYHLGLKRDHVLPKRTSICGVVCPLMPRLYASGLPEKEPSGPSKCQPSVIESPMKTTGFSPAAGGASFESASLNRASQGIREQGASTPSATRKGARPVALRRES